MKAWDNFKKLERIDKIQRVIILIFLVELFNYYMPWFETYIYMILGTLSLIVWIEIIKYKVKNK